MPGGRKKRQNAYEAGTFGIEIEHKPQNTSFSTVLPMVLYDVKPGLRAQSGRHDLEKTVGFVMATGLQI
nr:hypothetical protein BaRGS_031080 [Batillaria attramentaria]